MKLTRKDSLYCMKLLLNKYWMVREHKTLWPNRTKNVEEMGVPNEHNKQTEKAEYKTWNFEKAVPMF